MDQGAQDAAAQLIHALPAGPLTPTGQAARGIVLPPPASLAAVAATVTAAIDTASKLASYFATEHTVAPVSVSGVDAELLAVAVAERLPHVHYPARWPLDGGSAAGLVTQISTFAADAAAERAQAEELQAAYAAAAVGADAGRLAQLGPGTAAAAGAMAAYAAIAQTQDTLMAALTAAGPDGVPALLRIVEQDGIARRMEQGTYALLLQIGGTSGTVLTRRNIWTFLGGVPAFVSGGAIVSFLAVDKTGEVKAAGRFALSSGFRRPTSVGP